MELERWRCAPCGVTWVGAKMENCWSCGERPTHVKPYKPSHIVGSMTVTYEDGEHG